MTESKVVKVVILFWTLVIRASKYQAGLHYHQEIWKPNDLSYVNNCPNMSQSDVGQKLETLSDTHHKSSTQTVYCDLLLFMDITPSSIRKASRAGYMYTSTRGMHSEVQYS